MIPVTAAWKLNQKNRTRTESDVRITVSSYTLTKKDLFSFEQNDSGSIMCDVIPVCEIVFSCFMTDGRPYDFDPQDLVGVQYGYLLNNSWKWITKGYYKIVEKIIPANGLIATYRLRISITATIYSNLNNSLDDIYERGSWRSKLFHQGYTISDLNSAVRGSRDLPQQQDRAVGALLNYCSYGELIRQLSLCQGRCGFITYERTTHFVNVMDHEVEPLTDYVVELEYCYAYPEKETNKKFGSIFITDHDNFADRTSVIDGFNVVFDTEESKTIKVEPAKYAKFLVDGTESNYVEDNAISIHKTAGIYQIDFYGIGQTNEVHSKVYDSDNPNNLSIDCPLMFRTSVPYAYELLEFANLHNEVYTLKCRIDPRVELFDKISFETKDTMYRGIVEGIVVKYNGAFTGELRVRPYANATLYRITTNVSNGTYTGPSSVVGDETATITIIPDANAILPDSIVVSGASYTYDSTTGIIVLSNPTSDIVITADCEMVLEAPVISLSGDTLSIEEVANAEYYDIYVNGVYAYSIDVTFEQEGNVLKIYVANATQDGDEVIIL